MFIHNYHHKTTYIYCTTWKLFWKKSLCRVEGGNIYTYVHSGTSGKEPTCQWGRRKRSGFDPWVRKIPLEKWMTIYSSILAWRTPWTEELVGLQCTRPQRVGRDRSNWVCMHKHTHSHTHTLTHTHMGFSGGASGKKPACQCKKCKRCGFNPWVWKIPWRRAWQPTPIFLPGECHGQMSLVGYHPWNCKCQTQLND